MFCLSLKFALQIHSENLNNSQIQCKRFIIFFYIFLERSIIFFLKSDSFYLKMLTQLKSEFFQYFPVRMISLMKSQAGKQTSNIKKKILATVNAGSCSNNLKQEVKFERVKFPLSLIMILFNS